MLMRPWLQVANKDGAMPKALADDIMLIVAGKEHASGFAAALDRLHRYIKLIGGSIGHRQKHELLN